jgi:hypothetical protein
MAVGLMTRGKAQAHIRQVVPVRHDAPAVPVVYYGQVTPFRHDEQAAQVVKHARLQTLKHLREHLHAMRDRREEDSKE